MPDEVLRQLAEEILHRAPPGTLPASLVNSLSMPTPWILHDAAMKLLAEGSLDAAELVFGALLNRIGFGYGAAIGLARVAGRRGDREAACAAWLGCFRLFPDKAQPFWYVELAVAQRALGRHPDAEESLRTCTELFPSCAPAAASLASLLTIMGRPDEAVQIWRKTVGELSDQAQPWWIGEFSAASTAAGQCDCQETELDALVERFRDVPDVLAFRARRAATLENWPAALDLWTQCLEAQPTATRPEWHSGKAMALFRLWRANEALMVWQDLTQRCPDFLAGYAELASATEELGHWDEAEEWWSLLLARFPERERPEWHARRARCRIYGRPDLSLDAAIAELNARFPHLPLGAHTAIALARRLDLGASAFEKLVDGAVNRFPEDREALAQHIRVLLAHQRLAEAETTVRRLEETSEDHHALISRWRLTMECEGNRAIEDGARRAIATHLVAVAPLLAICEFLLRIHASWSMNLALAGFSALEQRFPGRVAVTGAKARTLIALRHDQAALEAIDAVPAVYRSQDVLELRAWAHARRDDVDAAKGVWRNLLSSYHFRAAHGAEPHLECVTRARAAAHPAAVIAFVPVRDEMAHLPEFLRHHRHIGIQHFVMVDNLSTDGSEQYLREQPDVSLYRTGDDFQTANCGMRWINRLIERHGAKNWCLFVDADESFIYPDWERTPLTRLTEYLDHEGAEAVSAFMLDLYPERLPDGIGISVAHADCTYYDGDYTWVGHVRPPYARPVGGIRARLFNVQEYLQKVPLIKSGRGLHIDNHETTSVRFAQITGALLHYKILGLVAKRENLLMPDCGIETALRYQRYSSYAAALYGTDLRVPGVSQSLTDSMVLAERGLMRAPAEYRSFVR